MIRKSMTFIALIAAAALGACSDATPYRATLDGAGMSPQTISAQASAALEFVNDDSVGHQIYSPDCAELSTGFIAPGDAATVFPANGPKSCHIEDILAPGASSFYGTVNVQPQFQPNEEVNGGA